MTLEIVLNVTEERAELLPYGVYRKMQRDNDAQAHFVAHFMVDDQGRYIVQYAEDTGILESGLDAALDILDQLPIKRVGELAEQLVDEAEEAAVPKA